MSNAYNQSLYIRCFAIFFFAMVLLSFAARPSFAQQAGYNDNSDALTPDVSTQAQKIFSKVQKSVYQIRIINNESGQKSAIGSGFKAQPYGYIVTNYHVISQAAKRPERYTIKALSMDNKLLQLKIRNIDIIHDIAILEPASGDAPNKQNALKFSKRKHSHGENIYSMGNPHDLGMTIIGGVYNGLLKKSFYKKILFSGAINSGMSGGPTLDKYGNVMGINVARSGDDLGYLVPAQKAIDLMEKPANEKKWKHVITDQLKQNSNAILKMISAHEWETREFSDIKVPFNLDKAFKCWGSGSSEDDEQYYAFASFACLTQDTVFISSALDTGTISYTVKKVSSKKLNPIAYNSLYENMYSSPNSYLGKSESDVKGYNCKTSFVTIAEKKWKTALCANPYSKFSGLYDTYLKAAMLGNEKDGYTVELFLDGFTKQDAQDFISKFLGGIK